MTKAQIIKALKVHEKRIAKERDALRELLYTLEDLDQNCDSALDDLGACIETLSQTL